MIYNDSTRMGADQGKGRFGADPGFQIYTNREDFSCIDQKKGGRFLERSGAWKERW